MNLRPVPSIRAVFILVVFTCAGFTQAAPTAFPTPAPVTAPVRFKNASPGAAIAGAARARGAAWWGIFHDRILDALENQALAANQDLSQAVSRVMEARQEIRVAAADFYPHLDADLSATRLRTTNTGPTQTGKFVGPVASAAPGGLFSSAFTTQPLSSTYSDFRLPLKLTYELDLFGRVRSNYGQARANAQASEADRQAVELSLTAQVATGYFNLRALDAQVAVLRRTLGLRQDSLKLEKERLEAGVANQLDVARAQLELDNTQSDFTAAVRQRGETENALAALCGQFASDFRLAERALDDLPPPQVPSGVPAALLSRRPDIIEAQRRVSAAAEGVHVARARMLPEFSIEGDQGYESAHFNQLVEDQSHAWEAVFEVKVPIFEGGRNLANLREARARQEEAVGAWRQTVITAFKEVENALVDLRQRASEADARNRAVANAGIVLKLSQQRYLEGAVNYFDVIDAERQLLDSELNRVQTLNARYAATVDLVHALGGDYP